MNNANNDADDPLNSMKECCDILHQHNGKPLPRRDDTVKAMRALTGKSTLARADITNVYGNGPLVLSDIPQSALAGQGIVLGVDEAGRGSLIGPMVYGCAYWDANATVPKEFNDSKQLSEMQRNILYDKILDCPDIGFATRVLHASEISRNMLRVTPYNLNEMSHDATIAMIRPLLATLTVQCCYIDTVGNPNAYKRRLEREFPGVTFVVESKADDSYAPCSAASIVAKVVRDKMLQNFVLSEPELRNTFSCEFGSGYPSDPVCKQWLHDNLKNPVFGYPDVLRFSWKPAKDKLLESSVKVVFAADDNDEDKDETENYKIKLGQKRQSEQMSSFLKTGKTTGQKRLPYFERHGLEIVTEL